MVTASIGLLASAAHAGVSFETWQFNGISIHRPWDWKRPGWCGGDCTEGHDNTFEIRGNNGDSEWVIAHEHCCYESNGAAYDLNVDGLWFQNHVSWSWSGDAIYFADRYWSVDEDRTSEGGCGEHDGWVVGEGYWATDVICDGQERVHNTYSGGAQCGDIWVTEHYVCTYW